VKLHRKLILADAKRDHRVSPYKGNKKRSALHIAEKKENNMPVQKKGETKKAVKA